MQHRLYIVNHLQSLKIPFYYNITLGRDIINSIPIQDREVSRSHVAIDFERPGEKNSRLTARDLGSRNGMQVNGQRVSECEFRPGDELVFGATVAVLSPDPHEDFNKRLTSTGKRILKRIENVQPFRQEAVTALSLPELEMMVNGLIAKEDKDSIETRVASRLAESVCELSETDDPRAFFDILLDAARRLAGGNEGVIMLREDDGSALQARAFFTGKGRQSLVISQNVMRIVLQGARAYYSPDTASDARLPDFAKDRVKGAAHSLLAIPLAGQNAIPAGFIYLETEEPDFSYGRAELKMLYALLRPSMRLAGNKGFLPKAS